MSSNSFPCTPEQLKAQPDFSWKVQQFQTPQTFSEKLAGTPAWSTPQSRTSPEPVQQASSSRPPVQREHSKKTKLYVANGVHKSRKRQRLNEEEEEIRGRTAAAIALSLEADHIFALYPDVDTPFEDETDVISRLLPYHVFQHPKQDLDALRGLKGKAKMTEEDLLREELRETNFAIDCHKRLKSLESRMMRTRLRAGMRPSPNVQSIVLERTALEEEQTLNSEMEQELSTARSELDKLLRAQRIAKMNSNKQNASNQQSTSSSSFYAGPNTTFTSTLPTSFSQYYSSYTYPYGQSYIPGMYSASTQRNFASPSAPNASQATQTATQPAGTAQTSAATQATTSSDATASTSAARVNIPLTMPVSSLPALQALGILPVPKAALPPPSEPQPAAVLLGSTNNGSMLSLEINAARLQPPQMSGLAVLLTTLVQMSGGTTNNQATGQSVFRVGVSAAPASSSQAAAQSITAASTSASTGTFGDPKNQQSSEASSSSNTGK